MTEEAQLVKYEEIQGGIKQTKGKGCVLPTPPTVQLRENLNGPWG